MSRKLVVGLLVMLSLVVTSFTYAYWSSVVYTQAQDANTVVIGEGRTVSVGVSVGDTGGTLVPSGQVANSVSSGPVEYVIFTFVVSLADNLTGLQTGTLAAVVNNVQIDSAITYAGLVVTAVQVGGTAPVGGVLTTSNFTITEGTTVNVYVKVTLTAPANVTEYNAIINGDITFDVDFTVTPA